MIIYITILILQLDYKIAILIIRLYWFVCVCVCVCVCEWVCEHIWIMTGVWHKYYKEKVTYEDITPYPHISKGL